MPREPLYANQAQVQGQPGTVCLDFSFALDRDDNDREVTQVVRVVIPQELWRQMVTESARVLAEQALTNPN